MRMETVLQLSNFGKGVLLLSITLPLILAVAMATGAYPLSVPRVASIFWGELSGRTLVSYSALDANVLLQIRAPRVLFGSMVGAALALGGVCMQALFRNPLADPGLMGLSSGAALAAAAVTLWAPVLPSGLQHAILLPGAAFLGGWGVTLLVYRVSSRGGNMRVDTLLLMGIAVNALCGALIGILMFVADDAQLRNVTFWSFGSLGRADWRTTGILAAALLPACFAMKRLAGPMNTLLMGEADAAALGVKVEKLKTRLVLLTCWLVSLVVAMTGLIGFVGLVIPHIARLLFGPCHVRLVPASLLLGAVFMPLVDMLCRTAVAPAELPIGLVTALTGTPFFIYLLVYREGRA